MFCKNCGSEIKDGVKFCSKCGATLSSDNNSEISTGNNISNEQINTQQNNINKKSYAETSFWCAILALPLICMCGAGLLLGPFAVLLGTVAIKNEESDNIKAWTGIILGIIETIALVIVVCTMFSEV